MFGIWGWFIFTFLSFSIIIETMESRVVMKKVFQKQLEELGFIRCNHCGHFAPGYIDTYNTQKTLLGFPLSKVSKGFVLRCDNCHHEEMINRDQVQDYIQQTKDILPYKQQLKIWKQIYTAHKYLSTDDDLSKDLGPFFEAVKKEAWANIPFEISEKDFNYIFNAYLTNLTKSSKKEK